MEGWGTRCFCVWNGGLPGERLPPAKCSGKEADSRQGMFKKIIEKIGHMKREKSSHGERKLEVHLDREASERLVQLKARIAVPSDSHLISLALECLERKTDQAIRRQAMRLVRGLKKQHPDVQQIADYLNQRKVPPLTGFPRWNQQTVAAMLEREERRAALGGVSVEKKKGSPANG